MIWTQIKVKCNVTDLETVSAVMSMLDNFIMTEDYRDIDTELKSVYGDLIDESILKADKTKGSCSVFVPEEKNAAGNTTYEEGQYFDNFTMNVYPAKGDDLSKILEQARAQMRLTRHNN